MKDRVTELYEAIDGQIEMLEERARASGNPDFIAEVEWAKDYHTRMKALFARAEAGEGLAVVPELEAGIKELEERTKWLRLLQQGGPRGQA